MKRLLDLPGLAELEADLRRPNAEWAPETDDVEDRVDALSLKHFGRTFKQTELDLGSRFESFYEEGIDIDPAATLSDPDLSDDQRHYLQCLKELEVWNRNFLVCDEPFEKQRPFWEAIGWDVTYRDGAPAKVLGHFDSVIIAATKSLPIQGAAPDVAEHNAEAWGAALEAEARRHRSSK